MAVTRQHPETTRSEAPPVPREPPKPAREPLDERIIGAVGDAKQAGATAVELARRLDVDVVATINGRLADLRTGGWITPKRDENGKTIRRSGRMVWVSL